MNGGSQPKITNKPTIMNEANKRIQCISVLKIIIPFLLFLKAFYFSPLVDGVKLTLTNNIELLNHIKQLCWFLIGILSSGYAGITLGEMIYNYQKLRRKNVTNEPTRRIEQKRARSLRKILNLCCEPPLIVIILYVLPPYGSSSELFQHTTWYGWQVFVFTMLLSYFTNYFNEYKEINAEVKCTTFPNIYWQAVVWIVKCLIGVFVAICLFIVFNI